jgi:hypothetical protein
MIVRIFSSVLILLAMVACVEPYEIKKTASTNILVVEGIISNQLKRHQIFLTRAVPLGDRRIMWEQGATVTLVDQNGNIITLTEEKPGKYETPEFSAQAGNTYTLHITTSSGSEYASKPVPYQDGPDLSDVYAKYVDNNDGKGKGIQVYADTEDPSNQAHHFRWSYVETYEVHAPFPSNWIWLGNNEVEYRSDGIDTCYVTDTLRNVILRSTVDMEKDQVIGQRLRFIPERAHYLRFRYSILVQQFCMSEDSYLYWDNLRKTSEEQGSLSDMQPGSLKGNIVPLTNPEETVLGYFEAARVSEKRIFFSAITFYNDGLKMPQHFRSDCFDIPALLIPQSELDKAMERYGKSMYIWEVYGMSPGATFELMPKSCCDCRDQGPTERPPFF